MPSPIHYIIRYSFLQGIIVILTFHVFAVLSKFQQEQEAKAENIATYQQPIVGLMTTAVCYRYRVKKKIFMYPREKFRENSFGKGLAKMISHILRIWWDFAV